MRNNLLVNRLAPYLIAVVVLACHGCREVVSTSPDAPLIGPKRKASRVITIAPNNIASLQAYYQAQNYTWETVEDGVPPFVLKHFPHDIDSTPDLRKKKTTFFLGLLPIVLMVNQEIAAERSDLLRILDQYETTRNLTLEQRRRIRDITGNYSLRGNPLIDHRVRGRLLKRVDLVPPSLALAQAANESAWGTSRFARKGNNLFGEWTFTPGTGIVPEGRPEGENYEVRKFKTLYDSVKSYMRNLNTHSAYTELREIRARLRRQNQPVSGVSLAEGLVRYSTRREAYVDEIRDMIRHNGLSRLNRASLRKVSASTAAIGPDGDGLLSSRYHISAQPSTLRPNP